MKNKIFVLLAVVFVLILSALPVLAADDEPNGFYDFGTHENVEINVYEGDNVVDATTENIDSDSEDEEFYPDSDRFEVTFSDATKGGYYGTVLVEGTGLPTKDDQIFYIDQVTAGSSTVDFNVYPILPEETTALSLYLLSNLDDFELIKIPVNYYVHKDYVLGDIDNNGKIEVDDALIALQIVAEIYSPTETELSAADVDGNGRVEVDDSLMILQYVAEIIDSWN